MLAIETEGVDNTHAHVGVKRGKKKKKIPGTARQKKSGSVLLPMDFYQHLVVFLS